MLFCKAIQGQGATNESSQGSNGTQCGGRAVIVLDEIVHPVTIDLLPDNAWHLLGGADKILTFSQ